MFFIIILDFRFKKFIEFNFSILISPYESSQFFFISLYKKKKTKKMELEDCQNNFEEDGIAFDVHIPISQYTMKAMYWKPTTEEIKGSIIFLHGLNSLKISEKDMGLVLNERGYAFFTCDHIGHGQSEGPVNSCTVEEIGLEAIEMMKKAQESYPGKPIFLIGHSLGGLTSLYLGMWKTEEILSYNVRGIIVICPFIGPTQENMPGLLQRAALSVLGTVYPTYNIKGFSGFEPEVNKDFANYMNAHAKGNGIMTPRCVNSSAQEYAKLRANADKWPESIPLLMNQGMKDAAVDPQFNVEWANKIKERLGDKVEVYSYENGTHNLARTAYRGEMMNHIVAFLAKYSQ